MTQTPPGEVRSAVPVGRFAPSTTGLSHPGTLLAALLCWLDVRASGGHFGLRLEDLDPERCRPEFADAMRRDMDWLGLDWDSEVLQSDGTRAHEEALDALAEQGRLYPCRCSRSELRAQAERAPDGSFRYPGTCRERPLPSASQGGWRSSDEPLRVRLSEGRIDWKSEESQAPVSEVPRDVYGDPVVRRRDGATAYHLASMVDDARAGVTRVVRGSDLAPSTSVQLALGELLGFPRAAYRHHLLLLERQGQKMAKFHRAVATDVLRSSYDGASMCGFLAHACELTEGPRPLSPRELLKEFTWTCVRSTDRVLEWDGQALSLARG